MGGNVDVLDEIRSGQRKRKTVWRRMQSRANFSPPNSLLTGKNTGNIAPSDEVLGTQVPAREWLAGETRALSQIGTGIEQGSNQGMAIRCSRFAARWQRLLLSRNVEVKGGER